MRFRENNPDHLDTQSHAFRVQKNRSQTDAGSGSANAPKPLHAVGLVRVLVGCLMFNFIKISFSPID